MLSLFITLTVFSFSYLGETRIDAYISMFVLEYAVLKAVVRPRRKGRDWLFIILIAVFAIFVSIRIYEVII
ncbi:hypothetical protein IOK49_03480 [Fervidicoccus fontis]|nr:hypothetical protein [Fervidicoccus fontis]